MFPGRGDSNSDFPVLRYTLLWHHEPLVQTGKGLSILDGGDALRGRGLSDVASAVLRETIPIVAVVGFVPRIECGRSRRTERTSFNALMASSVEQGIHCECCCVFGSGATRR